MYKAGRVNTAPATITPQLAPTGIAKYRPREGDNTDHQDSGGVKSYHVKMAQGRNTWYRYYYYRGNTIGEHFLNTFLQKPSESLFENAILRLLKIRKEMSIGNVGFIGRIYKRTLSKDNAEVFQ